MRLIVLGASNIAIHLPALVAAARRRWPGPLEIAAACGHGRSYGLSNRVLMRTLPGIIHCGLWEYLQEHPHSDQRALVTDVGNDLLYGQSVETILGWVEQCLERLRYSGTAMTVMGLPIEGVRSLRPGRYYFFRRIFFPNATLSWQEAVERGTLLDQGLHRLARRYDSQWLQPSLEWYAADPIHIRRTAALAAMHVMTGSLDTPLQAYEHSAAAERGALKRASDWWLLRSRAAHRRHAWGRWRMTPQPCAQLHDGTIVSLF